MDPKLTNEIRNIVMKATLGFFSLPNDHVGVVNSLIDNLITLLFAILLTSGEDGRSRAEQLLHILKQIDQYDSSPLDYERKRECLAVHEMLLKFRTFVYLRVVNSGYSGRYSALGCDAASGRYLGICKRIKQIVRSSRFNVANLPPAFLLPSRDALCLRDRVMVYLPGCADTNSEVRKISAQIGVITPYEGQRAYIVNYMSRNVALRRQLYKDIEVASVDSFQREGKRLHHFVMCEK